MPTITEQSRMTIAREMGRVAAKRQLKLMDAKTEGASEATINAMARNRDLAYSAAIEVGADLGFVNAWITESPDLPAPAEMAAA